MKKKYHFKTCEALLDYLLPGDGEVNQQALEQIALELCEAMGLRVKKYPKVDGSGMRTELWFGGEQGAIRCLCYRRDIPVKRTDISDFAKEYPEVNANHMIVMTTSSYSPGAVAYAQGTGIRIVNGEQLFGLMKKHNLIQELPSRPIVKPEEPQIRDLQEKKQVQRPIEPVRQTETIKTKSPLAARTELQGQRQASQRFDARAYLREGRDKVKPFR